MGKYEGILSEKKKSYNKCYGAIFDSLKEINSLRMENPIFKNNLMQVENNLYDDVHFLNKLIKEINSIKNLMEINLQHRLLNNSYILERRNKGCAFKYMYQNIYKEGFKFIPGFNFDDFSEKYVQFIVKYKQLENINEFNETYNIFYISLDDYIQQNNFRCKMDYISPIFLNDGLNYYCIVPRKEINIRECYSIGLEKNTYIAMKCESELSKSKRQRFYYFRDRLLLLPLYWNNYDFRHTKIYKITSL